MSAAEDKPSVGFYETAMVHERFNDTFAVIGCAKRIRGVTNINFAYGILLLGRTRGRAMKMLIMYIVSQRRFIFRLTHNIFLGNALCSAKIFS